jgi:hypothetical protein
MRSIKKRNAKISEKMIYGYKTYRNKVVIKNKK